MRDTRRGKIGLLVGVMMLVGAIIVPGTAAQSVPVRTEIGVLRLHLDNDGKYFRFDTKSGEVYTTGATQTINGSCPVTAFTPTDPQWVNLTGGSNSFSLSQVGLQNNGLGVRFLNCGRVDAPNWALRIQLGSAIDGPGIGVDRAELDLQGWGGVTVVADLRLDGDPVGSVTLPPSISGNGTRARRVIDRTGLSLFDEIRLRPQALFDAVALRGGGAVGSPPPSTLGLALGTNDTLFRVVSESNLSVSKEAVDAEVSPGDEAAFVITVTNNGAAVSNVGVTDTLPAGLEWSIDPVSDPGCTIEDGELTCTIPTLAGGGTIHTVRVTATTSAPGAVTNDLVTVSVNNAPVATDGPETVEVQVGPPAFVTFTCQPANTLVTDFINNPECAGSGAVEVEVTDIDGFPVADETDVIMSIGNDPTDPDDIDPATLSGQLTQQTSSGIASFPDLAINRTSSDYTLLAQAGSVSGESDFFAITNTNTSCGGVDDPCTATFPDGGPDGLPSTVTAPAGTVLIIETNQFESPCDEVIPDEDALAGTVTIIPTGTGVIAVEYTDTILVNTGPYPFCKFPPEPFYMVPICSTILNGMKPDNEDGVPCMDQFEEFTGFGATHSILHTTVYMDSTDPGKRH